MNILVKNGTVYDGSGAPPLQKTDVLIEGGVVRSVRPGIPDSAVASPDEIIDASDRVVTPGFVDMHRHADVACLVNENFGKTELAQGITTAINGNCGIAPIPAPENPQWRAELYRYIEPVVGPVSAGLPFGSYREYAVAMKSRRFPLNIGFLAGAGAIKTFVKGFAKGPFTAAEMEKAQSLVEEAMLAGARGLSFGIMYQPECYSDAAELAQLATAAAKHGGILCAHIRGEGDSLVRSVEEMIEVADRAGIPLNISHFKATGIQNWRSAIYRAIDRIEAARAKGQQVTADFYPYDGGSTTLLSLVPPSVLEESTAALVAKLSRKKGIETGIELLRRETAKKHDNWDNMALSIGWDRVVISSPCLEKNEDCRGRNMSQIAQQRGLADEAELLADLIASEGGRTGIIVLSMAQEDIDTVAVLPWTCLISDSLYSGGSSPHPRLNGAFPKFLREYVREKKLLSMETAIAKMTGIPAGRMGLSRGLIKEGAAADVLVFDPATFTDNADYANPLPPASGMGTVIINGEIATDTDTRRFNGQFI
jgi:N-acyl-D-aspartate/D-glutamate deacylase